MSTIQAEREPDVDDITVTASDEEQSQRRFDAKTIAAIAVVAIGIVLLWKLLSN